MNGRDISKRHPGGSGLHPTQPPSRTIDEGREARKDLGERGPSATVLCDEIAEGRGYSRHPVRYIEP